MAKIIFFEIETWEEPIFKANFPQDEVIFSTKVLELYQEYDKNMFDAEVLSTFVFSQLTSKLLSLFSNLKCIVTRSTGYDHIDIDYCKEKGIIVSNVPQYGVHTIVEHTFALMLALSRKIVLSVERTRKGNFDLEGLQGMELYGKTLGVIGTGNIGNVVCQIALGFGMKVIAYNRHPEEELEKLGVQFVSLDALLAQSDIATIHLPYVPETKHLINLQNIEKMKKGSLLINTARGPIVETQAILTGLEKGILSGAGLDVLEEECGIREEKELLTSAFSESCDLKTQLMDHILLNRDDVIVTPHNAFHSKEAMDHILQTTVENIQGFLAGKPQSVVSK